MSPAHSAEFDAALALAEREESARRKHHNDGPWSTGDGNPEVVYAGRGTSRFEIATVAGPTSVVPQRETFANSKLIAAAPTMLYALDLVREAFDLDDLRAFTPEQIAALGVVKRAARIARGAA